jgi:nucleotidyltransferase substrate binding protein (TIGR01987 family)
MISASSIRQYPAHRVRGVKEIQQTAPALQITLDPLTCWLLILIRMSEKLDLTALKDATASLANVLAQPENEYIRDAAIQRFEYTFELAWKMIRRHLDWLGQADTAALSRKDLFREGARVGLISDPEAWFSYNQARNESSHSYNRVVAEKVFIIAQQFLSDAQELVVNLAEIHD